MKRLFSPWRSQYIESFSKPAAGSEECVLCAAHTDSAEDTRLIVQRGKTCYVVMNLYPYNSGHLMIVPYRHISSLNALTDEECLEMMQMVRTMAAALERVSRPDGFNFGSNIGRTAGAGIDQHIHFHIVPRWTGDTNFMPVLADTKMISEDMHATLRKLRAVLSSPGGKAPRPKGIVRRARTPRKGVSGRRKPSGRAR
jgi:ATP adenylyltransferase